MRIFWHMTASGTLLILVLLLFRAIAFRRVPKRLFVLMWCIVLARLLIPYSIPVSFNPGGIGHRLSETVLPIARTYFDSDMVFHSGEPANFDTAMYRDLIEENDSPDRIGQTTSPNGSSVRGSFAASGVNPAGLGLGRLLVPIWFGPALFIAVFIFTGHIRWLKRYRTALPLSRETSDGKTVGAWLDAHASFRYIQVRQYDQIQSPLTFGIFRPVILLPSEITWTSEKELLLVLEHERVHIRHFDIFTKYVLCLILCIYWFHPLVWVMYALLNRDMELACDEEVLKTAHSTLRSDYACLLLKLAERQNCDILGAGFSKYSAMKERIQFIMKKDKYTMWACGLAAATILCMTAAFLMPKKISTPVPPASAGEELPSFQSADASKTTPTPGQPDSNADLSRPEGTLTESLSPTVSSLTGPEIAKLAVNYVGNPYCYGGEDLETGVDCSGFVKELYKQAGITLPRKLDDLIHEGTPVSSDELLAGDLIFYSSAEEEPSETPAHVALYLGDQKVIHASNARDGIKISDLNYRGPFTASRIITN